MRIQFGGEVDDLQGDHDTLVNNTHNNNNTQYTLVNIEKIFEK